MTTSGNRYSQGVIPLLGVGLTGQFFFPTTGISTHQQAVLLAVDEGSLPMKHNLCYYMTHPTVRKEPVLTPSSGNPQAPDAVATHFYGTVLHEGGKFRMWYYGVSLGANPDLPPALREQLRPWRYELMLGPPCYAESDDGLHWTKPNLGQVLFKGSRDNNALSVPDALTTGVNVLRDDGDPDPSRRYKMALGVNPQTLPTVRMGSSPDGINWKWAPDSAILPGFIEQSSFYKFNGLYILNGQQLGLGESGRYVGRSGVVRVSHDFDDWLTEVQDSFARSHPGTAGQPLEKGRRDEVHLGVAPFNYGNVLVGLYGLWHNDDEFDKISCDLGLVVSNDGLHFREPETLKGYVFLHARDSLVTPVPGNNFPTILCQAGGILNVGDETRIYHGRWRNASYDPGVPPEHYYAEVALATLPRDRWGALGVAPDRAEGSVLSCPVVLPPEGCDITLNAEAADRMSVDLLDDHYAPIPGYSGADAGVPTLGSGFDCPVKWPKAELSKMAGRTVRLRIRLSNAETRKPRLYAIYLQALASESPLRPESEYPSEEFTVEVGGRHVTARIVSPTSDRLANEPALLLTFANSRANSLFAEPYCLAARDFLAAGHRVVSFDLPAHGDRIDEFGDGIIGFRNALVGGVDLFARFVEDGRSVVSECIRRGWATPGRIAVCGTSRGGYMALRLLAAEDRISAGAGFAPATDWRVLSEFQADRERKDVANLRLHRFAAKLAGKHVYLSIGSADERVSTASCKALHRDLVKANLKAGFDASFVELNVTEDEGHSMGDPGYHRGSEFLLKWMRTVPRRGRRVPQRP